MEVKHQCFLKDIHFPLGTIIFNETRVKFITINNHRKYNEGSGNLYWNKS